MSLCIPKAGCVQCHLSYCLLPQWLDISHRQGNDDDKDVKEKNSLQICWVTWLITPTILPSASQAKDSYTGQRLLTTSGTKTERQIYKQTNKKSLETNCSREVLGRMFQSPGKPYCARVKFLNPGLGCKITDEPQPSLGKAISAVYSILMPKHPGETLTQAV